MGSTYLNTRQIDYEAFKEETERITAYVKQQQLSGAMPPKRDQGARV